MRRRKVVVLGLTLSVAVISTIGYSVWYTKAVVTAAVPPGSESMVYTLDDATARSLMQVVNEARSQLGAPSLQVAVIIPDRGWWTGSVGWADPEHKQLSLVRDHYQLGSLTKLYTATVILKLAEHGQLSLGDRVSKFLPDFPGGGDITIQQLLNHTSGLYNYTDDLRFQVATVGLHNEWSPVELLQIVADHEPNFAPGTRHSYSNSNYVLLGLIAERSTGREFSTLLAENVLQPLNLKQTAFLSETVASADGVRGYDQLVTWGPYGIKKEMAGLRLPFASGAYAAGAISATALDVANFTNELFTGELLQPSSKQAMLTFLDAPDPDEPERIGYGLGVRQLQLGGQELIGHTGSIPGFSGVTMYAPEEGYVVTVLANMSSRMQSIKVGQVIQRLQPLLRQ